jgi:hypothetical protein
MSSQDSTQLQPKLKNIFYNDLLFYVSEFLNDKDACNLFNTCKTINKLVKKYQRYSIKCIVTDKLNVPEFYKILKMNTSKKFTNLPRYLKTLTISGKSSKPIEFPLNIVNLECFGDFNLSNSKLPDNLLHLNINLLNCNNIVLPNTIENLSVGNCFNLNTDNLPSSLKYLFFYEKFNNSIDNLPQNLKHLGLSQDFNKNVDCLPSSLKYLKFGDSFNQHVEHLPQNLTHLIFGGYFNKPINNIPVSIVYLSLGKEFNHPLPHLPNLKVLILNQDYKQSLNNIPTTTKIIRTQ